MAPLLGATRANIRFTWDAISSRGQSEFGPAANEANRGIVLTSSLGAKRTMRTRHPRLFLAVLGALVNRPLMASRCMV
jgi:hypothetical protein